MTRKELAPGTWFFYNDIPDAARFVVDKDGSPRVISLPEKLKGRYRRAETSTNSSARNALTRPVTILLEPEPEYNEFGEVSY